MKKILKKLITSIITILAITSITNCKKLSTMKQEIVNAIDIKELALIKKSRNNKFKINADFFHGNDSLYISDKENNRILVLDEDNSVFLEIGSLQKNIIKKSEHFWEEELNRFLSQIDKQGDFTKKKKNRQTPRKKRKSKYIFQKIDKITSDFSENIYVVHYADEGMEILKFNSSGKFLYRIGENGRDNPHFGDDVRVLNISVSKDNGLWIKYLDQGLVKVRYYNSFGKNRMSFEDQKIESSINAFLEKKENEYHRSIEDILPLSESNKLAVIVNSYKKENGRFLILKKYFFQLNKGYDVEKYWEFDDKQLQVFNVNINNLILCFSYYIKENTSILKIYQNDGKMILEKKISMQKFNYFRTSVSLTQKGEIMGLFLKNKIVYFVIWK